MKGDRFKVGEYAVLTQRRDLAQNDCWPYLGATVEILTPLEMFPWRSRPLHMVRALADGKRFYACPSVLDRVLTPCKHRTQWTRTEAFKRMLAVPMPKGIA